MLNIVVPAVIETKDGVSVQVENFGSVILWIIQKFKN